MARKNLFQERSRFMMSVAGVACAILLITLIGGIYAGFGEIARAYFLNSGADIWVGTRGAGDVFHGFSLLPSSLSQEIGNVEGVREVRGLFFIRAMLKAHGKESLVAYVGYDPEARMGGPWKVVQGSTKLEKGEVIADRVFASKHGLNVGDELEVNGQIFRIKGVSEGTNLFVSQIVFFHKDDVARFFDTGMAVNYFLVSVQGPVEDVKRRIEEKFPQLTVLAKQEIAEKNTGGILEVFNPILVVILLIGGGVGATVVGLMIYTLTVERLREYGVLKAIGASNNQLYRIVLQQALIVSLVGYVVGGFVSVALAELISRLVPEVVIVFNWFILVGSLALALAMSLLASFFPVRTIGCVDPVLVFKA